MWSSLAHPANSHNFLSPIPALMCGIGEVGAIDCRYSGLRRGSTNYACACNISSNISLQTWTSLHLPNPGLVLQPLPFRRKPVRNGQFPKPSSVGCQIFHLTCSQQGPLCSLMPQTHPTSSPLQCSVHRYRLLLTEREPWPDALIGTHSVVRIRKPLTAILRCHCSENSFFYLHILSFSQLAWWY